MNAFTSDIILKMPLCLIYIIYTQYFTFSKNCVNFNNY